MSERGPTRNRDRDWRCVSKPWLQQPDETAKAYKAFECYLQERGGSQLDAYLRYCDWRFEGERAEERKTTSEERGCAPGYISEWATEHDWERRRKAYWRHIDEQAYDDLMASKKRRKVQRIELLDEAFEALDGKLQGVLERAIEQGEASVQDITFLLDKMLRQYREELDDLPTQNVDLADADEVASMLGVELGGDDG